MKDAIQSVDETVRVFKELHAGLVQAVGDKLADDIVRDFSRSYMQDIEVVSEPQKDVDVCKPVQSYCSHHKNTYPAGLTCVCCIYNCPCRLE